MRPGAAAVGSLALVWGLSLATLFLSAVGGQASGAAPVPFAEYQVKATWLLNFVRFTEFPTNAFASKESPIVVGVLGKDPFGDELERALGGKVAKGRHFEIRKVSSEREEMQGCHVLFIASSEKRRMRDLCEQVRKMPVLTVSDVDGFLEQGGVINFLLKRDALRFEISVSSAQAAGLRLDARLLELADSVRGKYE